MRRAPLLRRILGSTARASLVLLLALAALVLATFVGANLPWVRSWLAREAGALASRQIAGTLTITEIGHIGLFSVSGVDAQLTDGAGRRVLAVSGLAAELGALRAARSWFGEGPLELAAVRVAADGLSADLRADGSGELPLIRALEPRPSTPSAEPSRAPKPTELEIDSLTVRTIRMRGAAGMLPERPQGDLEVELRNLSGRGRLDSDTLELELAHVGAEARNLPFVGTLAGEVAGTVTLLRGGEPSAALAAEARWHGSLAQVPVDAAFVFAGRRLSGFVRSEAPAGAVMRLWPEGGWSHELGDEEPVDVLLAFEGPLDALALRAVIDSSGGDLYVDGRVDLERLSGHASVIGDDLDLGRWLASAPTTSVRFVAALAVEREEGALTGRLALRGRPGSIHGQPLPEVALSARLRPRSLDARLNAQLPGADVVLMVAVPLGASRANDTIALELQAEVSDLARALAPLDVRANLAGRGTLRARGRLELGDEPRLSDAQLRAELRALQAGGASAARASVEAAAGGPLDRLQFELRLDARRLSLANYRLDRLRARAEGGAEQLRLQAEIAPAGASPFELTARLSPAARTLSDVALAAGSGRDAVRISARAARVTDHGYAVDGLVVHSGSGELLLDGALRGDALRVNARASAFSAAAVARRLGLDLALPEGIADLSLQLEQRAGRVSGTLSGSVSELGVGPLQGGTLQVDLVAERGVLRGQAGLSAAPLGQARLRVDELELPERWRASALASLKGRVDLLARADLGRLARIERLTALAGGATLGGTLEARLELRGDGRTEPSAELALTTRELVWSLPPAAAPDDIALLRTGQLPRVWQGIDLELRLELAASELQAHAALVGEERSVLARLQGSLRMPLARLLRDPASVDAGALPVDVRLYVPERELDDFPALLRFAGVDGVLRAEVSARGPLGRPELSAHLELAELRLESSRRALPLTIVADGRLDGDRVSASAAIRDQRRPLVSLAAAASLGSSGGAPFHDAEIDLRSNGLPLDALGALLGQDVTGDLYGALSVRTNEGAPAAKGTLWVNAPSYRGFRQKQARWVLEAGAEAFSTELMLEQHGGGARLTLSGPWRWEGAALPSVDRRRLRAALRAERFELRALEPLLPEQARGVGGRLDANVALDPSRPGSARGSARVRDGRVYVAALGQEFRDIALDARLDESVISIERLSARALDGRVNAHGEVALEGLAFRGAELDVNIPRGDPLPIALEGVTVATAWGRLDVSARGESGKTGEAPLLNVNVRVPRLEVVLPRLNPHSVQQLAEDPTIETGTFLGPDRFTVLPLPPYEGEAEPGPREAALVVRVNVELGEEVWLQREPELELKVVGGIELELRDELSLDGQLRLARGNIEVQGREFRIERGEVTFQPDRAPSNPTVVATGVYTAPEGTRVYAEFVGPVETGELTLRSEPPLRDDQILSLLLFGSSDGNLGSATGDGAGDPLDSVGGTALVAGGNVVARGLNAELRRLTSLDIQTRIGSREGEPQPEVAVQLTPRVTAELAYRLEAPTPGRAPDRTYLTLDLRLFRNWSLSTTIGDAGSFVLDLLWRYRY